MSIDLNSQIRLREMQERLAIRADNIFKDALSDIPEGTSFFDASGHRNPSLSQDSTGASMFYGDGTGLKRVGTCRKAVDDPTETGAEA